MRRRFVLLAARSLVFIGHRFFSSHRFLIARIACPFPSSTKQEKRRDGWRRQMTKGKRGKRDARRDEEAGGDDTDGKQANETQERDGGTRREHETASGEKRKINDDDGDGMDEAVPFFLTSTQHKRRRYEEGNTFSFFRPTPSPQALSSAGLN